MGLKGMQHGGKENAAKAQARPQALSHTHSTDLHGTAASLLNLQRTHGNRFVQRLLNGVVIQRKCGCGGACAHCQSEMTHQEQNTIQHILQHKGGGQPLEPDVQAFMEPQFGEDFSNVRVHTDTHAAQTAEQLNAIAYTVGPDIFFGSGQYRPKMQEGKRLLAHELTHVVQQASGQVAAPPIAEDLTISDPSANFEQLADQVANRVVSESHSKPQDMQRSLPASSGPITQVDRSVRLFPSQQNLLQRQAIHQRSPVKESEDYTDALDYVRNFYAKTHQFIDIQHQVEATAISQFSDWTRIPNPPDLSQEIVISLMEIAFKVVGGWDLIKKGVTQGIFAKNLLRLQRGPGERSGEPSEREQKFGERLTTFAEEAISAGRKLAELKTESGGNETLAIATREQSLGKWGKFVARAIEEEQLAMGKLKSMRDQPELREQLLSTIEGALGPIPDVKEAGNRVVQAARNYELELYKARFGGKGDAGPMLHVIEGRSGGVYSREITGVGWTEVIEVHIKELADLKGKDIERLAEFLKLRRVVTKVTESPQAI